MTGLSQFDGLTGTILAIAVILSAIVSLVGTAGRRRSIALGQASVSDLSEMTGITDPKELQDTFGPPDMGRIWRTVTLFDVRKARQPMGWLISSDIVDWGCIAAAFIFFFIGHPLITGALLMSVVLQVGGWIAAAGLPK